MHQQAIALLPGETVLRRYAVLQALDGERQGAFDTMARLKIFATELHDWPTQLAYRVSTVDEQEDAGRFQGGTGEAVRAAARRLNEDDDSEED